MEPTPEMDDDLRPEYDLSQLKGGVRGKYAQRFGKKAESYETTAGKLEEFEVAQFLQRACLEIEPILRASVLPLLVKYQGRLAQLGTGTLFQVADASFIVTASHVVEEAAKRRLPLFTFDCVETGQAISLQQADFQAYTEPLVDVAIARLSNEIVRAMPNRRFLSVHQTDRASRRPENATYLVHGYPEVGFTETLTEFKLGFQPFVALTTLFTGDAPAETQSKLHLLLRNSTGATDVMTGADMPLPERLHGISGCSVWRLHYEGLSLKHWTPNDAAIVAVQTGTYGKEIIRATRWSVVNRLIRESYPDLAGPLSLVLPTPGQRQMTGI